MTPPSNLNAEVNEMVNVQINWEMQATRGLDAFRIYRDDEMLEELAVGQWMPTGYLDELLQEGSYSYYVTAVYDGVESAASQTVEVEINLPAPYSLSATITGENIIFYTILLVLMFVKKSKNKIGYVAQELKEVLPEAVEYREKENKYYVNYKTYEKPRE